MSHSHKKILLLTASFFLMSLPCMAQGDFSISVSAAVMESTVELTTLRSISLDRVQPGQNIITISPIDDNQAGKMVAVGNPNAPIRISFLGEWELTNLDGGRPLTFQYSVAGNQQDNQSTAELLETENRSLRLNEDGNYYLWIGGRVDVSNAQPGNYIGEFTIEIEYM